VSKLRIYEAHGVDFVGDRGDEKYGSCPFSGKPDKFYVNTKTALWSSKTAGMGGNVARFLKEIQSVYQDQLTKSLLKKLAEHRQLSVEAVHHNQLGWTGDAYAFGVQDYQGIFHDIRTYKLGGRVMSTAGCTAGLWGAHLLAEHPDAPVYVCEGEWDCVALRYLHRLLDVDSVVVSVPGAGVFKQEWVPWFERRVVHTLFDADEAGENGELLVQKRLKDVARSISFTHWPDGVKSGFDVRDWIVYGVTERNTPQECWTGLQRRFQSHPRKRLTDATGKDTSTNVPETDDRPSQWGGRAPTYADVVSVFRKWLFLDSTDAIELMLAVVLSQYMDGSPIWLFIVSPPGGAKTETLTSLARVPNVYMTSSLTAHSLISGANWKGDQDPSLIPQLNGKIMVIKDFTSILSMRDTEKDEIFGILRDAYDGRCGKVFGTGIRRDYKSKFTMLAAVTPRIYDLSQQHHSLGERFLKVTIGDNLVHQSERDIIRRAIENVDRDTDLKFELQDVVSAYLRHQMGKIEHNKLPKMDEVTLNRVIDLGRFGARLRGTVSHDQYRPDIITSRPSAEVGTRLGVQLSKLGRSLALVRGRRMVGEPDLRLLRRTVLDTISQRTEDVVRTMHLRCPTRDDVISAQDISMATRYPVATISRLLQDLDVLGVVDRVGTRYKHSWTLSEYIRKCISSAGLYETEEEQTRTNRKWVRMVARRGRTSKVVETEEEV